MKLRNPLRLASLPTLAAPAAAAGLGGHRHYKRLAMLALALSGACGLAHATETSLHNDLDGDGYSDVLWRNADTGAVVYWRSATSSSSSIVEVDTPSGFDLRRMNIALTFRGRPNDFDPTHSAIALQDQFGRYYGAFFNWDRGYGYYAFGFGLPEPGMVMVGAGDFDGNGTSDLLFRNPSNGRNSLIAEASWGGWAAIYPITAVTDHAWKVAGIGDFDGDLKSDILWRNTMTGRNTIWRSGRAETQLAVTSVTNQAWKIIAVGDFNGDGRSDIFWRNTTTGANVIWKSANATMIQSNPAAGLSWRVAATGDYDGDGTTDLLWRNTVTGANIIWGAGSGSNAHAITGVPNQAWQPVM